MTYELVAQSFIINESIQVPLSVNYVVKYICFTIDIKKTSTKCEMNKKRHFVSIQLTIFSLVSSK